MKEAIRSSEKWILTISTWRNIPEDEIVCGVLFLAPFNQNAKT
jgi:hypothetical protein